EAEGTRAADSEAGHRPGRRQGERPAKTCPLERQGGHRDAKEGREFREVGGSLAEVRRLDPRGDRGGPGSETPRAVAVERVGSSLSLRLPSAGCRLPDPGCRTKTNV